MNQVGSQFGVQHFTPDALQNRQKVYQKAVEVDQNDGDANATKDQVEFNFEGRTTQVIIDQENDRAMARTMNADGEVLGVERLSEKVEVATRTYDGFAAQTAEELPGTGGSMYSFPILGVNNAADPEAAFNALNQQFASEWKIA